MTSTLLVHKGDLRITILPIDELKPHEKGAPLYLELIKQELLKDGLLRYPIVADEKTHVILDGMHRWLALKSLGYKRIPVVLFDALETRVRIGRKRIHRYTNNLMETTSIEDVVLAGLSGNLMKPRTTRHFFPFFKPQQINYPLHLLGRQSPQDVSPYLAKMSVNECSIIIKEWLEEISEELDFLMRRKEEVEKEREDLLSRVKSLKLALC